jgi:hypothetical protein
MPTVDISRSRRRDIDRFDAGRGRSGATTFCGCTRHRVVGVERLDRDVERWLILWLDCRVWVVGTMDQVWLSMGVWIDL